MADSNFVNWNDYLGLNKDSADATANQLTNGLDAKRDALTSQQQNFSNEALMNGTTPGANAYGSAGGEQNYRDGLMSYGDAIERLKDPGTRQAVMQQQFGQASGLDSALVGAAGGDRFAQMSKDKTSVMQGDEVMGGKVATDFAAGRAQRGRWDASDAADAKRRQGLYDQNQQHAKDLAEARSWTQKDMVYKGWDELDGGRNYVDAQATRNAYDWETNNVSQMGGNDAAGNAQRTAALAKAKAGPNYGAYNAEMRRRQAETDKHNARSFSLFDPHSW